jgi:hypothetical protein
MYALAQPLPIHRSLHVEMKDRFGVAGSFLGQPPERVPDWIVFWQS